MKFIKSLDDFLFEGSRKREYRKVIMHRTPFVTNLKGRGIKDLKERETLWQKHLIEKERIKSSPEKYMEYLKKETTIQPDRIENIKTTLANLSDGYARPYTTYKEAISNYTNTPFKKLALEVIEDLEKEAKRAKKKKSGLLSAENIEMYKNGILNTEDLVVIMLEKHHPLIYNSILKEIGIINEGTTWFQKTVVDPVISQKEKEGKSQKEIDKEIRLLFPDHFKDDSNTDKIKKLKKVSTPNDLKVKPLSASARGKLEKFKKYYFDGNISRTEYIIESLKINNKKLYTKLSNEVKNLD